MREEKKNLLLFIIVRRYCCYYYFINGLGVVNVYLIRLLLHIDYDGARCEWNVGRDERVSEIKKYGFSV